MKRENLVSKFAFFQMMSILYRYGEVTIPSFNKAPAAPPAVGGVYTSNSVYPQLETRLVSILGPEMRYPGFKPLLFEMQLAPLTPRRRACRWRR
jgi:hypothetical protein